MPDRLSAGLLSLLFLAACQPAPVADAPAIPLPLLEGPIANTASSHTWNGAAWQKVPIDLSAYDYVEEEYLATGTARVYDWVPGSNFDLWSFTLDTTLLGDGVHLVKGAVTIFDGLTSGRSTLSVRLSVNRSLGSTTSKPRRWSSSRQQTWAWNDSCSHPHTATMA